MLLDCLAHSDLDSDRADTVLEFPVNTQAPVTGEVGAGSHVSAGEKGYGFNQVLAVAAGRDVTAVKEEVSCFGQGLPP